jgi:hypothetical protein
VGVTEEIFRIRYELQGQGAVNSAKAAVLDLEGATKHLRSQLEQGTINTKTFNLALDMLARETAVARREMQLLERAALGGGMASGKKGMMVYQLGEALTDLQYGLHGAINNLNYMASMGGLPPQVMLGFAAASAAATALYFNYDRLMEAFEVGIPNKIGNDLDGLTKQVGKLNEELSKLEGKKRLDFAEFTKMGDLREQIKQLERLKQIEQDRQRLNDTKDTAQKSYASSTEAALARFGGDDVLKSLTGAVGKKGNLLGLEGTPEQIATQLISGAQKGSQQSFQEIERLLRGTQIGDAFKATDPAFLQKAAAAAAAVVGGVTLAGGGTVSENEKTRLAREKEVDRLNQQGRDDEIAGRQMITDQAIKDVGDVRGRVQLGLRMAQRGGEDMEEAGKRLADALADRIIEQGGDPQMARRRAEEMVREDRNAFARDGQRGMREIPMAEEQTRQMLVRQMLGGSNPAQAGQAVAEQLAKALERAGVAPDEAKFRANQTVEQQQQLLQQQMFDRSMNPKIRPVETIAATDFARNIQDGNDVAQNTLKVNEKQLERLTEIARGVNQGGRLR